jgi:hypothetical protein
MTKLLSTLINTRLCNHLASKNILIKEQAGFRAREEAIAQVISLIEICNRRRADNKNTIVMCLDMKKAFDLVPQEAILIDPIEQGRSTFAIS